MLSKVLKNIVTVIIFSLIVVNCSSSNKAIDPSKTSIEDAEESYMQEANEASEGMASTVESIYNESDFVDPPEVDLPSGESTALDRDAAFGEPIDIPDVSKSRQREMSSLPFKQGMYDFLSNCQMREEAHSNGAPSGQIRAGKTLWVEPFNGNWLRVYKKSGPVYISRSCLH